MTIKPEFEFALIVVDYSEAVLIFLEKNVLTCATTFNFPD